MKITLVNRILTTIQGLIKRSIQMFLNSENLVIVSAIIAGVLSGTTLANQFVQFQSLSVLVISVFIFGFSIGLLLYYSLLNFLSESLFFNDFLNENTNQPKSKKYTIVH